MARPAYTLLLALLVPGSLPGQARERVWTATFDTVAGVPRVTSPGYTAWRDTTFGWRFQLERTFDLRDADSGSWNPQWRIHLLTDGRVVVFTPTTNSLELYDVEGRYVRTIGRQGAGPEEYESMAAFTAVGDTLVVNDGRAGRLVLYTLDGRFLRSFRTGIHALGKPIAIDPRGHVRVEQGYGHSEDSVRTQWVHFTLRGARVDSITMPAQAAARHWMVRVGTGVSKFTVPFSPAPQTTFLADGTLVYGNTGTWEFVMSREGRDSSLIFRRVNVEAVPLPASFADTVFASATAQFNLKEIAKREDMPTVYPAWNDFVSDGLGNLWVSTGSRRLRNHYWGVFGPDGRYLGAVAAWFDFLNMSSWGTDRVAFVGWVERQRAVVRIYRIVRPEHSTPPF